MELAGVRILGQHDRQDGRLLMHVARTVIAFMIALSVAMLPAAGAFAFSGEATTVSVAPCDHHAMSHSSGHHGSPVDKLKRDCRDTAGCGMHCFGFYGAIYANLAAPVSGAAIEQLFLVQIFLPQMGHPPFRPPRG